jgi:hypothetical protein
MTPDAAAQAVHERLEHLVTTMPEPDLEAGWAALVAQLEPPVAPVVPLRRRPKARRAIVLGVAAAVLVAGAAFAAVRHGGTESRPATVAPRTPPPGRAVWGPHIHLPLFGPHVGNQPASARSGGGNHDVTGPSGGPTSSGDRSGSAPSGSDRHGKTHVFHHDAPDDTDHGTGNDGTHDDNGNGNNAQGQDTSGNASGSRGTHLSGGGDGPSGRGSQAGPGSESHGQGSHG